MEPLRLPLQNGFIELLQNPNDATTYNISYTVFSGGQGNLLFGRAFHEVPTPEDAKALAVAWIATCFKEIGKERDWLKKSGLI